VILMFRPEDLDWRYWGLGLGFGIRDWGFSLRLGLVLGIRIGDWRLGLKIAFWDWDQRLGLGIRIEDWDREAFYGCWVAGLMKN